MKWKLKHPHRGWCQIVYRDRDQTWACMCEKAKGWSMNVYKHKDKDSWMDSLLEQKTRDKAEIKLRT